jgi:transcriptional regulator with XRE-family HTH domain
MVGVSTMVEYLTQVEGLINNKSCIANFYQGCNAQPVFRSDRLLALMAKEKLSQSALARRVGVSNTAIWKLLNDPAQGSKHTHRIARELGTSPEFLMGETDNPEPNGDITVAAPSSQPVPVNTDLVEIAEFNLAYGLGGPTSTIHRLSR